MSAGKGELVKGAFRVSLAERGRNSLPVAVVFGMKMTFGDD